MLTHTELSPPSRPASQPDGLASNTSSQSGPAGSRQLPESMPVMYTDLPTENQQTGAPEDFLPAKSSMATRNNDSADSEDTLSGSSSLPVDRPTDPISSQTRGIIFLSTPHRGNYSLMFLYHFPMFFALTPEARQLRQSKP
ncbi:unnamed protein product [Dibothriocephalus latus]|uniref:Uncharacterized protein n=1 Tax=Dibothriocephalus latus TaxID=60516 RepID=A0A3P7N6P0_DIBLA|nr:unnamed protein product [Dibothriocephalus latus]